MDAGEIAKGRAVWALALGQMLGYACLYYIFAALVLAWHDDLGWTKTTLATGPTLAIVISACLAPFMGRAVDRGYGPELLVFGAALGALALVLLSQVTTYHGWLACWALIGIAQAACLYEVCFSFLIRRLGPAARVAIIRVTLVAGFASTLAFPAGAALAGSLGWRGAVWVAAGTLAFGMLPLHVWGAWSIRRSGPPPQAPSRTADNAALRRAVISPAFWLLAASFSLISLNHWMIVNFLVPVFLEQGASHGRAVLAAAIVGPAQVGGRLVLMQFEDRIGTAMATKFIITTSFCATLVLWAAGIAPVLIFVYALTQGAAIGIVTILRPMMIVEVLGQAGYGSIAGMIQIPGLLAGALAPVLGAFMLSGPGVGALLGLSLCLSLAALGAVFALGRVSSR